jgi:hypothetical protein
VRDKYKVKKSMGDPEEQPSKAMKTSQKNLTGVSALIGRVAARPAKIQVNFCHALVYGQCVTEINLKIGVVRCSVDGEKNPETPAPPQTHPFWEAT